MENLKKLDLSELKARAKKLYFEPHKEVKEIFVDEYGRFSYSPSNLVEMNRLNDGKVFKLTRESVKEVKTEDLEKLTKPAPSNSKDLDKAKKETEAAKAEAEQAKAEAEAAKAEAEQAKADLEELKAKSDKTGGK